MTSSPLKTRCLAKQQRGASLVELMVVVLILSILVAVALPLFEGQADKAKNTDTKTQLSTAEKLAKSTWQSNDQAFPSQAALVNAIEGGAPELDVVGGSSFVADQVQVERAGADDVTLRSESASGEKYAIRLKPQGAGAGTYRAHGTDTTLRTNLVTNPKAGAGTTTDWSGGTGVFEAVDFASQGIPEPTVAGAKVASGFKETWDGSFAPAFVDIDDPVEGDDYQYWLIVYIDQRPDATSGMLLDVQRSSDGSIIASSGKQTTFQSWFAVPVSYVGESVAFMRHRVRPYGTGSASTYVIYWTTVLIEQASSVGTYFDGDYPGGAWTGTPHESVSTGLGWESW